MTDSEITQQYRVLVCGSRTVTDAAYVGGWLDQLRSRVQASGLTLRLVVGGARGADHIAESWAQRVGVPFDRFPADWDRLGKRAGFVRNQAMLDSGVHLCAAFVDKPLDQSRGTADMVGRCRAAAVPGVVVRLYGTPPEPNSPVFRTWDGFGFEDPSSGVVISGYATRTAALAAFHSIGA